MPSLKTNKVLSYGEVMHQSDKLSDLCQNFSNRAVMFYQYDITDGVILIEQAVTTRCYFLLLKYVKSDLTYFL